jgi:hypothetical protein
MGDATKYPLADLIEALASELREANKRAVERPDRLFRSGLCDC